MSIKKIIIRLCVFAFLAFSFLLSGFASTANGSQIPLSESSTDLTSSFKIDRSGIVLNRSTNTYDSIVKITNTSNQQIQLPVALVILDTPGGVSVYSPSGTTLEGNPYLVFGSTGQSLDPGKLSTAILKYSNPTKLKISSTFRILAFSTSSDQGLGGTDNNNNGVRDAIEAVVTSHYSSSARRRAAAFQVLAGYRTVLLNQATVEEAFNSISSFYKALECMGKIWGVSTGNYAAYEGETRYLENLMLDNKDRIKAYLQINDKVAGQVFRDAEGQTCTFDPNSLPN